MMEVPTPSQTMWFLYLFFLNLLPSGRLMLTLPEGKHFHHGYFASKTT
jgi:hypothetical protein